MHILIVDDEDNLRKTLAQYLSLEGWTVTEASNGLSAKKKLEEQAFNAVALDLRMPGMDGLELLEWLNGEGPSLPVVMMSAYGDVGDAVNAMKAGASDYLVKPFDPEELIIRLKKAARTAQPVISRTESAPISRDAAMRPVIDLLNKAAPSDATILITGESGTGKEVAARYIHRKSERSQGPFIAVNLGGLPEGLIESELFGYEKGAFTGADSRRIGYFEAAGGGTLFLDEIGELPSALQVKLLRSLQEKKIQRLGGTGVIPVDVRIIAATNRNLEKAVAEGSFREDLFYRINVINANMLPLRERPADIVYLAELFLHRLTENGRTRISGFSDPAIEVLASYSFPGNVRELENMIERAVILAESTVLQPRDFTLPVVQPQIPAQPSGTLKLMEIRMIQEALLRNEGHRERTALELGITRKTLLNKINTYGLSPENEL
ncbi:MAG: sigma-54-dependent Fis family transcriptional regulator [Spirochaetes bacterium]|nr:MAG: sigma-54-dependent Fis family transcriptional regulator [Spirochaetota bacterium]RKX97445.1 MAG: sigma-54-dependent Fis family transcriptional regulator [Spirochaetota bacterium]